MKSLHKYAAKGMTPSDASWISLNDIVTELLPEFITAIGKKGKDLSDKEEMICILTKLNFSPSEIGILPGLTKQRITNLRSKLNNKLFGGTGTKSFDSEIHRL